MTLQEAQAKLDEIYNSLGLSKAQYQGRSVEFPVGTQRAVDIAILTDLIKTLTSQQNGASNTRCTYGSFNRS